MIKLRTPSLFSTPNHFPLFLGLIIILSDQLTKALIRGTISIGSSMTIIPSFFSIVHFTNTGAGFGILKNNTTVLSIISIVTIFLLFFYYRKTEKAKATNPKLNMEKYALAAIMAGAFSNLIDRIIFGTVTDFIYFHFWPAFNIADSAITIGAIVLVAINLKSK